MLTYWRAAEQSRHLRLALPILALLASGAAIAAGPPSAGVCGSWRAQAGPRLEVSVTHARRIAGNVTITLYGPNPEAFLARGGRLARQRIALVGTSVHACFVVSEPGDYAIAVYHDENNDRNFNRTLLGLPAEGYGFSNDAPAVVGLPSFSDVRFPVGPQGARLSITLRY